MEFYFNMYLLHCIYFYQFLEATLSVITILTSNFINFLNFGCLLIPSHYLDDSEEQHELEKKIKNVAIRYARFFDVIEIKKNSL